MWLWQGLGQAQEVRAGSLDLTLDLTFPVPRAVHGKPLGAVGSVSLPPAQIPLPSARAGRGSGLVRADDRSWGQGGEAPGATSQREEAKLTPSAYPTGRVWRPVGGGWSWLSRPSCPTFHPVFCLAVEGASPWSGDSVGKRLCSSTSSIPCSPNSTPSLLA